MFNKKVILLSSFLMGSLPFTANASISDWIASPTGNNASDWTMINQGNSSGYTVEDWVPNNNGYIGPGYGGQEYDAEAMYLRFNGTTNTSGDLVGGTLDVAIITGLAPGTHSNNNWTAGDIGFDINGDRDSNNQLGFEYGQIVTPHEVRPYDSNGDWLNQNHIAAAGDLLKAKQVSGESDSNNQRSGWVYSDRSGDAKYGHPVEIFRGEELDNFALTYELITGAYSDIGQYSGAHYLIETSLSFTDDGGYGTDFLNAISANTLNVHWNPTCDNDNIIASLSYSPTTTSVPEPGSLALLALGLVGFRLSKRKS